MHRSRSKLSDSNTKQSGTTTLNYDPKHKSVKYANKNYLIEIILLSIFIILYTLSHHKNETKQELTSYYTKEKPKATIAYAVSLTGCAENQYFIDGAAVLKHSIHLSSIHNPYSGSKYSYKLFVIVHPNAKDCVDPFHRLNYEVLERDTPIDASEIRGEFLRQNIVKSGCCQEKELIKLWAYTLVDYEVVVHLDLDALVVQPMDELFDTIIDGPNKDNTIPVMFNASLPKKVDAYFTRDYNLIKSVRKHVGVQGGFFAIRPSLDAFEQFKEVVLEGNYVAGGGWGGLGYGGFYGAQQIQGLLPYYYDHLHNGTAVELNRCYYNTMVDHPRFVNKKGGKEGLCKDTGTDTCDNCQETNITDIKLVHFTICQKPWLCRWNRIGVDSSESRLCNDVIQKWFRIRRHMEDAWIKKYHGFVSNGNGTHRDYQFFGFCTRGGIKGYKKLTSIPVLNDDF